MQGVKEEREPAMPEVWLLRNSRNKVGSNCPAGEPRLTAAQGCQRDSRVDPGRCVNGSSCTGALSGLPRPWPSCSFSCLHRPPRFCYIFSSGSLPPTYLKAPDPSQARVPLSPISLKKSLLLIQPANFDEHILYQDLQDEGQK